MHLRFSPATSVSHSISFTGDNLLLDSYLEEHEERHSLVSSSDSWRDHEDPLGCAQRLYFMFLFVVASNRGLHTTWKSERDGVYTYALQIIPGDN